MDDDEDRFATAKIPIKVSTDDMFAVLARNNLEFFKEKTLSSPNQPRNVVYAMKTSLNLNSCPASAHSAGIV